MYLLMMIHVQLVSIPNNLMLIKIYVLDLLVKVTLGNLKKIVKVNFPDPRRMLISSYQYLKNAYFLK